jgi:hypothetical protein
MAALTYNAAAGNLTIGGIAMMCPAWKVLNLYELWQPAQQRGSDRLIPGAAGVLAQQRRKTVTARSLQMLIIGSHDRTGSAYGVDLYEGLQGNLEYLIENVIDPTGLTDGTRSAVLTMPDSTARTEPIHVLGLQLGEVRQDGAWMRAVIDISVPSGRII